MSQNCRIPHSSSSPNSSASNFLALGYSNGYRLQNHQNDSNRVWLIEAQRQHETYEEMKRLLIFAGLFFLFAIAFILMRFNVSIDDVIKWSPIIWLLGIVSCGLLMNLLLQFRRFLRAREAKRERERLNCLNSIHLPNSFPCLAPPGSQCCHRHQSQILGNPQRIIRERERPYRGENSLGISNLPPYEQIDHFPLISPPAFVIQVQRPKSPNKAPPKYKETGEDGQSLNSLESDEGQPPNYDQQNVQQI